MAVGSKLEILDELMVLVGAFLADVIDKDAFLEEFDSLLESVPIEAFEVPFASRYARAFGLRCYGFGEAERWGRLDEEFMLEFAREFGLDRWTREYSVVDDVLFLRPWSIDNRARLKCVLTDCDYIVKLVSRDDKDIFDSECYVFIGGDIGYRESEARALIYEIVSYAEWVSEAEDELCYYRPSDECIDKWLSAYREG